MKRTLQYTTVILAIAFLAACTGKSKSAKSDKAPEIVKENLEKDVREFVYPLPSSFEVTNMLNRIEASYILSLSNPVSNIDKYFTTKSQALNLGIYSADLSYASTYNQKQETVDFMNASKKLIDKLDITAALDPNLLENIENNLENKEELVNLITDSFYDTYEYLNKNERTSISMLVLAGSWVEALYISTHISEDTFNNKEMIQIIMDQKEPLLKLMTILNEHSTDADVLSVIDDLKPITEIYRAIDMGSITLEQLTSIIDNITVIRTKFVS